MARMAFSAGSVGVSSLAIWPFLGEPKPLELFVSSCTKKIEEQTVLFGAKLDFRLTFYLLLRILHHELI
jgi:hypothetical protein